MSSIYAIVTYHEDAAAADAAEAWKENGVAAIGWRRYGDLRKNRPRLLSDDWLFARARKLFLGIRKGDVVLAYAKRNMIGYVGSVMTQYSGPTNDNEVAKEFGYQHQIEIEWWAEPHHFDRTELPPWLAGQLGRRGVTVAKLDLGRHGFEKTIEIIRQCAISRSALEEFEDLAKAGLRKYMSNRMDSLEPGLKIRNAERFTSESDKPDFVAVDKNGTTVLIECKGSAYERDCDQLQMYGRNLRAEKRPRLMLIAFRFDEECRRAAKSKNIELVECDLSLTRR